VTTVEQWSKRLVVTGVLGLVVLAGCHRTRPVAARPEPVPPGVQVGIFGPSSSPFELPRRAALRTMPQETEWPEIGREATELLAQYLSMNTTNPPGNEIQTARFLEAVLAREGITSQVFEPAPGKANIYARLRGDGSARAIILLSHMDVVEATREYWSVDPFAAVVRDGFLYGRGALDMKGQGIAQLMAMILLKRSGVPLRRDIIFLATADEEVGGMSTLGAAWIAREHPELVRDAEFLINEGGGTRTDEAGNLSYFGIGTTEKAPFWLSLTTRGTAGHGSRPTPDNAVERLVRALARVEAWETPLVVTPVVDRFFKDLATRESNPRVRGWLENVGTAITDPAGRGYFTGDLYYNAILRNTISVTRVQGSGKVNVIPPTARAEIDVRLLPGQDPQQFLADLRRVVSDTAVAIEPLGAIWSATESPAETELFRVASEVIHRRFPNVLVTTPMLSGFTDSHYFRRMGIVAYGLQPFVVSEGEARGVHGNDERISLANVEFATHYLFDVLRSLAGR
jgi:acetylornithine deacetylase/succinyl-diaminopimelate desuccinylase-like protein